jgi:hypothetical protein
MKASDEGLSTDAMTLTQKCFAAEGYQSSDDEEYLNLVAGLIDGIFDESNEFNY